MNCKPGDIAIVVRSEGPNLGVLVQVDKLADAQTWVVTTLSACVVRLLGRGDVPMPAGTKTTCRDSLLRPIRPDDEPIETREPVQECA